MANYLKDLPDGFNPGPLDLDKPLDNQIALLKLQADFSGADVQGGFGGQAWAWLPGKENILFLSWNNLDLRTSHDVGQKF